MTRRPETVPGEPPVVEILRPEGGSPFVLVCEHASNFIPTRYHDLGLPKSELTRHIAYDIGASGITRTLSALLDAPAFLSGRSRLLIDGNRPPGCPTSIPPVSESTIIPGNVDLPDAERRAREQDHFWPFHAALADHLDRRIAAARPTRIVAIHSFTPTFDGASRPYEAGILFRGRAGPWALALLTQLEAMGKTVLVNAPYQIEDDSDYLIPFQAEPRGLDGVLIEVRQDLVARPRAQREWARTLAAALLADSARA